jgi:hypothetical protein
MGAGNGFSLTVPAEPTQHTLRIYLSSFGADYRLTAHMSDNSAIDYTEDMVNEVTGTGVYRLYTFMYQSLMPGQTMNVSWVDTKDHFGGSNVTLQAATLQ